MTPKAPLPHHDLLARSSLPEDQLVLAKAFPREAWHAHENIAGMAAFWLERHAMFRRLGKVLTDTIAGYREGRMDAQAFTGAFAPKLRVFLAELDGHHRIEDEHYFPVFARVEPRLRRGFDILDGDHHAIGDALNLNAEAANSFLRALQAGNGRERFGADAYADANSRLVRMLARHLDDEEDLIIPLILLHGERSLRP